jgi:hypothetical protein
MAKQILVFKMQWYSAAPILKIFTTAILVLLSLQIWDGFCWHDVYIKTEQLVQILSHIS